MRLLLTVLISPVAVRAYGQQPAAPAAATPPRLEERVDVIAVTPVHGVGLPVGRFPSNVQVFTAGDLEPPGPAFPSSSEGMDRSSGGSVFAGA